MMTRKPETIDFWWGRMPHWEVLDGVYFVTIHLRGAIPKSGRDRIHRLREMWKATSGEEEIIRVKRLIFEEMEKWLEDAPAATELGVPGVAAMVMESINHRHSSRVWRMIEHVIMPSHIHLMFQTDNGLRKVLEEFKSWTGREANRILAKEGRFWQAEWFDHWSRSPSEDDKIKRYIRNNPSKAGLVSNYRDWPYGSWSDSE